MKRTERHHLKENEIAHWVLDAKMQIEANKNTIAYGALGLLVIALAVFGTMAWRSVSASRSTALLADAMTVAESPVTAPVAGQAGGLPSQPAGTYPSDRARLEAALPKFQAVYAAYPGSAAGYVAQYRAASALVALGRADEALAQYRAVSEQAGGVMAAMAKLGMADAQLTAGRFDDAVAGLKALVANPGDDLPTDGVLMQLGRAYRLAGKTSEARQSFQRVVDEFPTSVYATEARRERDSL